MRVRAPIAGLWPAASIPIPIITLILATATASPSAPILPRQSPASWEQYVRAPSSAIVRPHGILSNYTQGSVTNPSGLISVSGSSGATVLTGTADQTETPSLVVDFGQNVVGQLLLDFAGSTNGSGGFPGVRLAFSEALEYLTDRSDYTRSDRAQGDPPQLVTTGTDQIAVKNEPYTWENQWGCSYNNTATTNNLQVCADGLHAFRYVRISLDAIDTDAPYTSRLGRVNISSVALRWSGYLGTPETYDGWFECADASLTQYWFDGAYTAEMGTDIFRANDTEPRGATSPSLVGKLVLHDGAKRDRDPYMGDLAVAALTSYLSHSDASIAALNVLEDLAAHQRNDGWIPPASINEYTLALFDYPLYWVVCSWDYVFYTGNTTYVDAHYPNLVEVLDTYYPAHTDNSTQLLVRPDGYGDFAFLPRPGSAAYYSALYVLALNKAASLADLDTSHAGDATRWRARAAAVSQGFQATLWDSSVSAFFDRKCSDSTGCSAHAQDGNSLAILSGIANATTGARALAYLSANNAKEYGNAFYDAGGEDLGQGFSDRVYAFISYFEGAARFETNDIQGAMDLVRRTWGWYSKEGQDPGITHWEGVGAGGAKYEAADTSLAHGWSTGVTPLLTTYVLGVKPTAPGFREWTVQVHGADVDNIPWARGVVPTPYGPLGVNWTVAADGTLDVVVDPPMGTNGTVLGRKASEAQGMRVEGGKKTAVRFVGDKATVL
ncbi:glycoside hydrolase family 78 protein [Nemania sp. FL0916]|nr:glycoside hydrolase family 78 protein [Nemania sp. FL0916]